MESPRDHLERQYGRGRILDSILSGLKEKGKDTGDLNPADLAPVDAFHIRGREATVELANRASLKPGDCVLDVGCGLGGSARYLADEHECRITGIDLTTEYVETAKTLTDLVGLGDRVEFQHASALDLPFEDGSFDVVWTEHAQMNISDKLAFYSEIARVLKSGGKLAFHDIFRGPGGPLHYPVPWAEDASIDCLAAPEDVRSILDDLGFTIEEWADTTNASLDWFLATLEKLERIGPPPLGVHLLMGENANVKFKNQIRNVREGRFVTVQAVARKASCTPQRH